VSGYLRTRDALAGLAEESLDRLHRFASGRRDGRLRPFRQEVTHQRPHSVVVRERRHRSASVIAFTCGLMEECVRFDQAQQLAGVTS